MVEAVEGNMEEKAVQRRDKGEAVLHSHESHTEKRKMQPEDYCSAKKVKTEDGNESEETCQASVAKLEINQLILKYTLVPRLIIVIVWVSSVSYATYEMFLAAEEHLLWQKDPVMNPGPFTRWIGRGRDITDFEWTVFTETFFRKIILWYGLYIIMGRMVQMYLPKALPTISAFISYVFLTTLIGVWPATYLLLQPVVFWFMTKLQSRTLIWLTTFGYLYLMENSWHKEFVNVAQGVPEYYFAIISAWNAARCISFCFDTWGRPEVDSAHSILTFIQYCFYFPLTINGPLILFDKYKKQILLESKVPKPMENLVPEVISLSLKLGRMVFWTFVIELLLHYLYFRPLALTITVLYDINWWALCGVVYWLATGISVLGQFFQLKYVVMYGIPSAIAEFEGLPAPPLPKCIAYIHRYSVLWKDFDRGLYYFLVRYTYLPTLEAISKIDTKNWMNLEFRKFVASLASFIYVYVWHNGSYEVFIWTIFNFLGITIERAGSFVKRRVDAKSKILPAVWDVCIEPVVTIPLAVMSVINSAVFCGTLPTAYVVLTRFFKEFQNHYVPYFFFCFTTVGVLVRTWPVLRRHNKYKISETNKIK